MPLALIHDWLNQIGGAEDVLETLVGMFPSAPIYTSMYWREHMPAAYRQWPIRVSFMDRLPGIYRHHQPYLHSTRSPSSASTSRTTTSSCQTRAASATA